MEPETGPEGPALGGAANEPTLQPPEAGSDLRAELEAARKKADAVKGQMMKGDFVIFKGPIKDNKGNAVIGAGTERGQTDPELEKMNYLVEGVIGATS